MPLLFLTRDRAEETENISLVNISIDIYEQKQYGKPSYL